MSDGGANPDVVGGGHCLAPSRTIDAPVEGATGLYSAARANGERLGLADLLVPPAD